MNNTVKCAHKRFLISILKQVGDYSYYGQKTTTCNPSPSNVRTEKHIKRKVDHETFGFYAPVQSFIYIVACYYS